MPTQSSWMNPKLEIRDSRIHGRGVFAIREIRQNERLAIFGGDILLIDEIMALPEHLRSYPMQIEERFVLGRRHAADAEDTDYFNHSCQPNAGFRGQIFLVAMRGILADEEVAFDYAMVVSESVGSEVEFDMDCNCGNEACRRRITERDWLIPTLRAKYQGFFSQYLQDRLEGFDSRTAADGL